MFKHILVPTDGSRLSLESARAAVQLARSLGARVTAFFAAPPATPIAYKALLPVGYVAPEEHRKRIEKAARAYLGAVERAAKAAGVPCETAVATSDFPADAILAAARKCRCDLVFMASHGRRGLRRSSLLGSETQKVLACAPMPVLVYRKPRVALSPARAPAGRRGSTGAAGSRAAA
jgi:nucleotide-binding universal stress UspA family protein